MDAVFVAVSDSGLIIPALEFQHVQRFLQLIDLLLNSFFSRFEKLFSPVIGSTAFLCPFHKPLDIPNLQARSFQTFDHPQRFHFSFAEFSDPGLPLQIRKQAFFVIIA